MDVIELDQYNGDAEHDMWVDFVYHKNTGELSEYFDVSDLDVYADNLNDWDRL